MWVRGDSLIFCGLSVFVRTLYFRARQTSSRDYELATYIHRSDNTMPFSYIISDELCPYASGGIGCLYVTIICSHPACLASCSHVIMFLVQRKDFETLENAYPFKTNHFDGQLGWKLL